MDVAYVLTDLGYGDGVKGGTTDWLVHNRNAHTVVRTGGPQAFHTVITATGLEHTFSQFGSGTLRGARTHLSRHMVTDPYALLAEGRALRELGITNVFELMTVHEDALVIAPFQAIANRLRELARGPNRHGTVGIGVGEAVLDSEKLGLSAIRAKDLTRPGRLREKLEAIRALKLQELASILEQLADHPEAQREIALLRDPQVVDNAVDEFTYAGRVIQVVNDSFVGEILAQPGVVVFEPSQGIPLDRWYGFHPHNTKLNTTSSDALALLKGFGHTGEVKRLGVMRAYTHRHGAGPFVTEDAELTQLLPDLHNGHHPWQGHFRVGHLDMVLLRYAIAVGGGPGAFDGLVVSCMDRLGEVSPWQVVDCYTYHGAQASQQFFETGDGIVTDIRVRPNSRDSAHLHHQEQLGKLLRDCKPVHSSLEMLRTIGTTEHERAFASRGYLKLIQDTLGVPVVMASYGPTDASRKELLRF